MGFKENKTTCSNGCGNPRRPKQRTCKPCHALAEQERRAREKAAVKDLKITIGRLRTGRTAPVTRKEDKPRLCGTCKLKGWRVLAAKTHTLMAQCTWCVMGMVAPVEARMTEKQWERQQGRKKEAA